MNLKIQKIHTLTVKVIASITIFVISLLQVPFETVAIESEEDRRREPTAGEYLELRAVEVKEEEGKNKQLIMELWGHNLQFKRIYSKISV